MIGKTDQSFLVFFKIDNELLNLIKEEYKDLIFTIDIENPEHRLYIDYEKYLNDENEIEINSDELYNGKIININIENFEYPILINKDSFPCKLKKAEFKDISYSIFNNPNHILSLNKKFISDIEGGNFNMYRLFQII